HLAPVTVDADQPRKHSRLVSQPRRSGVRPVAVKMAVLQTGAIEERSEHVFGFEKLTRNLARRSRMTAIISVNFAHRFGDFRELAKTEESTLLAVDLGETGLLRNYRTSGGKIAGAAIAEPSGVQSNVLILGDGELSFGSANVIAIIPVIDAQIVWGAKAPTSLRKLCSRLLLLNICGQLKCFPGYFRGVNETHELTRFAPQIFLSTPHTVCQSACPPTTPLR